MTSWEVVVRLLAALGLGAAVGLERELTGRDAGLRTHATVALGAALFGVISTLGFDQYAAVRADTNVQIDVTRVASQVVVGIGFLGAGLIFRERGHVQNLTTAASLWAIAAIGLACGVGIPGAAAVTAAILLVTLAILKPVRAVLERTVIRQARLVRLCAVDATAVRSVVDMIAQWPGVTVRSSKPIKDRLERGVELLVRVEPGSGYDVLLERLAARDDVVSLTDEAHH